MVLSNVRCQCELHWFVFSIWDCYSDWIMAEEAFCAHPNPKKPWILKSLISNHTSLIINDFAFLSSLLFLWFHGLIMGVINRLLYLQWQIFFINAYDIVLFLSSHSHYSYNTDSIFIFCSLETCWHTCFKIEV